MNGRGYTITEIKEIMEYAAHQFEQRAQDDLAQEWRAVAGNFNEWAAVWEVEKDREEAK